MRLLTITLLAASALTGCSHISHSTRSPASKEAPLIQSMSKDELVMTLGVRYASTEIWNRLFKEPYFISTVNKYGTFYNSLQSMFTEHYYLVQDQLAPLTLEPRFHTFDQIIDSDGALKRARKNILALTHNSEAVKPPQDGRYFAYNSIEDVDLILNVGNLQPNYHSKGFCNFLVGGDDSSLQRFVLAVSVEPNIVVNDPQDPKQIVFSKAEALLFRIEESSAAYNPGYKDNVFNEPCAGKSLDKIRVESLMKLPGLKLIERVNLK